MMDDHGNQLDSPKITGDNDNQLDSPKITGDNDNQLDSLKITGDNDNRRASPKIEDVEWGFMKVEGYPPGKDFKLFPGGAEVWDWNKTKTRHVPGIQRKDVEDLINSGAKYIVLSKGMEDRLKTPKETEDFLKEKLMKLNVDYFIETTPKACELYNQFVEEHKPVGALIHSTC